MFWSIETDDFKNICGKGKYPMLTLAKNKMVSFFIQLYFEGSSVNYVTQKMIFETPMCEKLSNRVM
jgi:hypothetical protein